MKSEEIAEINAKISEANKAISAAKEALGDDYAKVAQALSAAKNGINTLDSDLKVTVKESMGRKDKLKEKDESISTLTSENETLTKQSEKLTQDLGEVTGNLANYKSQIDTYNTQMVDKWKSMKDTYKIDSNDKLKSFYDLENDSDPEVAKSNLSKIEEHISLDIFKVENPSPGKPGGTEPIKEGSTESLYQTQIDNYNKAGK